MFGFQRVADLIWAAADSRCKGFLLGATSGRTTLAGEGLQHQDGNSQLWALTVPNLMAYDPAFAYELTTIVQDGLKRMYADGEDIFYYITVMNENYVQPPMPEGVREGILKGMYKLRTVEPKKTAKGTPRVRLLGSGTILNEVLGAADILAEQYGVASDIYSVTSYKELYKDAQETERWNMLHPDGTERKPYIQACLGEGSAPIIAASDYVKALTETVGRWMPGRVVTLGTDGFGRSDGRRALRDFFEVDSRHVVLASLSALVREGGLDASVAVKAREAMKINPEKRNPMYL
jgi:pyruvate dehydrogenase E1 component